MQQQMNRAQRRKYESYIRNREKLAKRIPRHMTVETYLRMGKPPMFVTVDGKKVDNVIEYDMDAGFVKYMRPNLKTMHFDEIRVEGKIGVVLE